METCSALKLIRRGIHQLEKKKRRASAPMSPSIARKALDLLSRLKPDATNNIANSEIPGMLSKREKEVLELLVSGKDYKAIAEKLFVSNNTIRTHIANIYEKLHVSSKTQVVTMAIQRKWFEK